MNSFRLTGPLTEKDFISYYNQIRNNPDFYSEKYGESLSGSQAYIELARYIAKKLKPSTAIDIGCGKGVMVKSLRENRIDARGLDWSKHFMESAPEKLRTYLECCDLLNTVPNYKSDLVICMETLEHFPPSLVPQAIERLKMFLGKQLFVTVPSFGPNLYGPYGIQVLNDEWMEDAKNDHYFRYIVVDDQGVPHHGHLTLATYNWWTREFVKCGLNRVPTLESDFHSEIGDLIKLYKWNIYIFEQVSESRFDFNSLSTNHLGSGWYEKETFTRNNKQIGVRWTARKATCYLKTRKPSCCLTLKFYSGPIQLLYDYNLYISMYHYNDDKLYLDKYPIRICPDNWYEKRVMTGIVPPGMIQITLELTDGWISKNYTSYNDPRELGIAIQDISLDP